MANSFTFGGVSTADLGLTVEHFPDWKKPVRKVDRYSVAGRNGDIIVEQDAWENTEQTYQVWGNNAIDVGGVIASWLYAQTGYRRLEDTFDPTHYRLAAFVDEYTIENVIGKYGRTEIKFTCDPRRFLKSGEQEITFNASGTIVNPTAFTAKPTITVHGVGEGSISCGGNTLEITGIYDGMVINCELENAFSGSLNLNNLISGKFPIIPSGEQAITFTGGITDIVVLPNWWTL